MTDVHVGKEHILNGRQLLKKNAALHTSGGQRFLKPKVYKSMLKPVINLWAGTDSNMDQWGKPQGRQAQ